MSTLWVSHTGDLLNDDCDIVREKYMCHFSKIKNSHQLRATIRTGHVTDMSGYPLYFITADGGALCFDCAQKEYRNLAWSMRNKCNDGWLVVGCDVNYEDDRFYCDHCNTQIESAYGESN